MYKRVQLITWLNLQGGPWLGLPIRFDAIMRVIRQCASLHFLPSGSMAVLYIFFCGLSGGINFQRLNVIFMQWRFCAAELRCSIFSLYAKAP